MKKQPNPLINRMEVIESKNRQIHRCIRDKIRDNQDEFLHFELAITIGICLWSILINKECLDIFI